MALITLLDGSQADTSTITYSSPASATNPYGSFTQYDAGSGQTLDISLLIATPDKINYWGFDPTYQNNSNYVAAYAASNNGAAPPDVGSTSTLTNLASQLYNNPLGAPLEQLNTVITGAEKTIVSSSGITSVLWLAAAGVALYVFWPKIMAKGGR